MIVIADRNIIPTKKWDTTNGIPWYDQTRARARCAVEPGR